MELRQKQISKKERERKRASEREGVCKGCSLQTFSEMVTTSGLQFQKPVPFKSLHLLIKHALTTFRPVLTLTGTSI